MSRRRNRVYGHKSGELFKQSVFPSTANRSRAATSLAINIDGLEMTSRPDLVLELGAAWNSDTEIIVEVC